MTILPTYLQTSTALDLYHLQAEEIIVSGSSIRPFHNHEIAEPIT